MHKYQLSAAVVLLKFGLGKGRSGLFDKILVKVDLMFERVFGKRVQPGFRLLGLSALGILLVACVPTQFNGGPGPSPFLNGQTQAPSGEVIGTGSVRVALLAPKSATGNAGTIGAAFRNAAALALSDFPNANIQLLVKDTRGTPEGAQAAAVQAVSEGAELILGPVFGDAVGPAATVAASRRVPVISFSTRTEVARRSVYLMGFLPQDQVYRAAAYAASTGRRSFAILVPDTPTGLIYEGLFREAAANAGLRVLAIERYRLDRTSMQEKVGEIAKISQQIDGIFMPDGTDAVTFMAQLLSGAGINAPRVLFVGSGQWDDPKIAGELALRGGIYASAPNERFDAFAARYRQAYGANPPRNASLAYDAVILAAGLSARFGQNRFSEQVLTNADGFVGIDGVFRFNQNGTNTRAMSVYEIQGTGVKVVSPAPATLNQGGF